MIVSWWSTSHQVGTTANMLSVASSLTTMTDLQTLLFHTHKERSSLESYLSSYINRTNEDSVHATGLSHLESMYISGILKPGHAKSNTKYIIPDKLYYLEGRDIGSSSVFDKFLPDLLDLLNLEYKVVFVDIPSGSQKFESSEVIRKSDVVVVNLTQNLEVLDNFFNKTLPSNKDLQGKELFYCIGNFESNSHQTLSRISKTYGIKSSNIGCVPRNVKVIDECNSGKLIDFVLKSVGTTAKDWAYDDDQHFGQNIKETATAILNLSAIPLIK